MQRRLTLCARLSKPVTQISRPLAWHSFCQRNFVIVRYSKSSIRYKLATESDAIVSFLFANSLPSPPNSARAARIAANSALVIVLVRSHKTLHVTTSSVRQVTEAVLRTSNKNPFACTLSTKEYPLSNSSFRPALTWLMKCRATISQPANRVCAVPARHVPHTHLCTVHTIPRLITYTETRCSRQYSTTPPRNAPKLVWGGLGCAPHGLGHSSHRRIRPVVTGW